MLNIRTIALNIDIVITIPNRIQQPFPRNLVKERKNPICFFPTRHNPGGNFILLIPGIDLHL